MYKKLMKFQKNAFTMSEALITLSIIGVIAAITIPSIINNHKANINRTRLKKASEVYSNVIVMMTSENNIKANVNSLDAWGSKNACDNVRQYFKIVQTGGTGCQFKTSDGVWWSFGKDSTGKENGTLSKPIIAFKMGDLATAKAGADNNYDAFYFVTQFDANKKARVLDLKFGEDEELNNYKAKVYAFMNKKGLNDYLAKNQPEPQPQVPQPPEPQPPEPPVQVGCVSIPCEISYVCPTNENANQKCNTEYTKTEISSDQTTPMNASSYGYGMCDWDSINKVCTETASSATVGDLYVSGTLTLSHNEAVSNENCSASRNESACKEEGDYWILAKRKCEQQGARLPSTVELKALSANGVIDISDRKTLYWTNEGCYNTPYAIGNDRCAYKFGPRNLSYSSNVNDSTILTICVTSSMSSLK